MSPLATSTVERARRKEGTRDSPSVPNWSRPMRGFGAGVVGAVVAGAAIGSGVLGESLATALVLILVLAVPLTPDLASRVATSVALIVGVVPLIWWVDWPFPMNHAAVLTGLLAGGLCCFVMGAANPRARLVDLLPQVSPTDCLVVGAAMAAGVATLPLTAAGTPLRALTVLVPGADNWAHYAMFANLRAYGAVPQALGWSPDGSGWAFSAYPKSFHALVATLSEIGFPRLQTGPDSLVAYAHSVGLTIVLGTVLITAAVVRLPGVRGRLHVALPAVAATWTALLWEPGQKVMANGFASFWVGAVAAGAALLLALEARRQPAWVHLAAVGGLLVCVAQTWTPLLILAAPAALLVLVPEPGMRRSALARWLPPVVVLAAAGIAAAKVVVVLVGAVSLKFLVGEVSGFDGTSPWPTFVLLLVLVLTLSWGRSWARMHTDVPLACIVRPRLAILLLTPALGVLSLGVFLALQMHELGTTSYYFLKYFLGFELVLACITPAVCALLVPRSAVGFRSRPRGLFAGLVLAAVVTQLFAPVTQHFALLFSETDDGTAAIIRPYTRVGIARGVLAATEGTEPADSLNREYIPIGRGNALQIFYPDAWYHAINGTVTNRAMERMNLLRFRADRLGQAVPLVRSALEEDDAVTIVVADQYVAPFRKALGRSDLARRVHSLDRG